MHLHRSPRTLSAPSRRARTVLMGGLLQPSRRSAQRLNKRDRPILFHLNGRLVPSLVRTTTDRARRMLGCCRLRLSSRPCRQRTRRAPWSRCALSSLNDPPRQVCRPGMPFLSRIRRDRSRRSRNDQSTAALLPPPLLRDSGLLRLRPARSPYHHLVRLTSNDARAGSGRSLASAAATRRARQIARSALLLR